MMTDMFLFCLRLSFIVFFVVLSAGEADNCSDAVGSSSSLLQLASIQGGKTPSSRSLQGDTPALADVTGDFTVSTASVGKGDFCLQCEDGLSASEYIESKLGLGAIENGDMYDPEANNRRRREVRCQPSGKTRLRCGSTSTWPTNVFKFDLYLEDCEPVSDVAGKQRNEIKVFSRSDDSLKGYQGETMVYSWKFRVHSTMKVSRKFTHIFQMKFVGGDSSKPAATFSGAKVGGVDFFQVRNTSYSTDKENVLATVPWKDVAGKWMMATVEATMKEMENGGRLKVDISRVDNGKSMVSLDVAAGLWRLGNKYMRPKWGIYRQGEHKNIQEGDLNKASIYFTDFCIHKKPLT